MCVMIVARQLCYQRGGQCVIGEKQGRSGTESGKSRATEKPARICLPDMFVALANFRTWWKRQAEQGRPGAGYRNTPGDRTLGYMIGEVVACELRGAAPNRSRETLPWRCSQKTDNTANGTVSILWAIKFQQKQWTDPAQNVSRSAFVAQTSCRY